MSSHTYIPSFSLKYFVQSTNIINSNEAHFERTKIPEAYRRIYTAIVLFEQSKCVDSITLAFPPILSLIRISILCQVNALLLSI